MTSLERRVLGSACVFSVLVSLATVTLIAADIIDTALPIWIGLCVVFAAYAGLQQQATQRARRSPTRDAIDQLRTRNR